MVRSALSCLYTRLICRIELCQRAGRGDEQLVPLHGLLFRVRCADRRCNYEHRNHTPEPTVRELQISPSSRIDYALTSSALNLTDIPSCPRCQSSKLRPGVCWFGEELPPDELNRVERWFQNARKVDLILVVGTERTPFVREAQSKGAEVAWLNLFENGLVDTGGDWYVSGNASETLPALVDRVLCDICPEHGN